MTYRILRTLVLPLALFSVSALAQTRDDASPGARRDEGRAAALGTPTLRTFDEAVADAAKHIAPQPRSVPFHPTMTRAEYAEAKAAANRPADSAGSPRLKTNTFQVA